MGKSNWEWSSVYWVVQRRSVFCSGVCRFPTISDIRNLVSFGCLVTVKNTQILCGLTWNARLCQFDELVRERITFTWILRNDKILAGQHGCTFRRIRVPGHSTVQDKRLHLLWNKTSLEWPYFEFFSACEVGQEVEKRKSECGHNQLWRRGEWPVACNHQCLPITACGN